MANIIFTSRGFADYKYWQIEEKRKLKKVNDLIESIERNGHDGIGKPEQLGGNLSGLWSRRIDEKNRIIYHIKKDGDIEIIQCKGHYSDK